MSNAVESANAGGFAYEFMNAVYKLCLTRRETPQAVLAGGCLMVGLGLTIEHTP